MKPLIHLKKIPILLTTLVFLCCEILPVAQAVIPPPDGGYPGFNTAEGQNALSSLTTGVANTAVGWYSLFSNTDGSFNTSLGAGALLFNVGDQTGNDGVLNTAIGAAVLLNNTTGRGNTAVGAAALLNNTTGNRNTAMGGEALYSNTTGDFNTAIGGYRALFQNTTGDANTAVGAFALFNNTSGDHNIGLGRDAGSAINGGSENVCLGFNSGGAITTGSGIITIGQVSGVHSVFGEVDNRTYIANILHAAVDAGTAQAVYVDADGRLGTSLMAAGPEPQLPKRTAAKGLRPQANPEMDAMLNRKVEALEATVVELRGQLKEQAAQIQKVSAQLELNKLAPQTVLNNR